jgi:hypothetical protein
MKDKWGEKRMADIILYVVQFFTLILVLINTIFTQKGFSNMNRWLDGLMNAIKTIPTQTQPKDEEGERVCKKCGKKLKDHKFGDLKACGLLGKQ